MSPVRHTIEGNLSSTAACDHPPRELYSQSILFPHISALTLFSHSKKAIVRSLMASVGSRSGV